jgi:hypothetical protein
VLPITPAAGGASVEKFHAEFPLMPAKLLLKKSLNAPALTSMY